MSEQLRESLSAAMDDEADAFELRRVLDEATVDDALRERWHRFHMVRDLLREDVKVYRPGLRDAIWEALGEPNDDLESVSELVLAETGSRHNARSPWLGRLAGVAVAAVVAVLVVVNGGVFDSPQNPELASNPTFTPPNTNLVPVMYPHVTALDQQRQNGLMLHHIQQRAMNQPGVASFVKVATFRSVPIAPRTPRPTTSVEPAVQQQRALGVNPTQ